MSPMIRLNNRSSRLPIAASVLLLVVAAAACSSGDASTRDAEGTTRTTAPSVTTELNRAGGASSAEPTTEYLEPTDESVATTIASLGDGPFVMLNLFRLRDEPDFSKHPEMKPKAPMTLAGVKLMAPTQRRLARPPSRPPRRAIGAGKPSSRGA